MLSTATDQLTLPNRLPRTLMLLCGCLVTSLAVGCVPRSGSSVASHSTYPSDEEVRLVSDQEGVERSELALLAERLGLGGTDAAVVIRPRIARVSPGSRTGSPFVVVNGNRTFPAGLGGGNGTFAAGGGNGSFPFRGNRFGNGSYPADFAGNGSFARFGAAGTFPQGAGNTTFGSGGGRFVPIRGAGSRGLPLGGGNVTFGSSPGFPLPSNSTSPR